MADSELALDGYRLFRKDLENHKSDGDWAGGVMLYVKSSFNAVEKLDIRNETFKESIWCEIQIMGDFNYHIDWEYSEGEKEPDRIFLDFIETSFMQQHVTEKTRGKNILDLVITSDENMMENVSFGEQLNTS